MKQGRDMCLMNEQHLPAADDGLKLFEFQTTWIRATLFYKMVNSWTTIFVWEIQVHPWQWVCVAPKLMLAMLALANGDRIRHGETLFSIAKCDADHTRIAEHFATVAFRKAPEPSMQGSLWIVARIMWNYVESKGLSCCLCVVLTWQGLHNWEGNDGTHHVEFCG